MIQPIKNSDKYLIVDLTNPTIDKTQHTSKFKFLQYMGFIHLSQSLVVAGGYDGKGCGANQQVYQINENHSWFTLPSMKYSRRTVFHSQNLMMVSTIVAICGYDGKDEFK